MLVFLGQAQGKQAYATCWGRAVNINVIAETSTTDIETSLRSIFVPLSFPLCIDQIVSESHFICQIECQVLSLMVGHYPHIEMIDKIAQPRSDFLESIKDVYDT